MGALAAYSFVVAAQDGVTYSGILGYRVLDIDYEQGSGRTKYEYDVLQHRAGQRAHYCLLNLP